MSGRDDRADPVAEALTHLYAAVAAAEALSGADIFSPWSAFAAQIRLAASAIDPTALPSRPETSDTHPSTTASPEPSRRSTKPLPGPTSSIWICQVSDLLRIAEQLENRP